MRNRRWHRGWIACVGALVGGVLGPSARAAEAMPPVALRPPMGWNSYNCFSYAVTEEQVKANADYMAEHLKPYGWEYIVVDYVWSSPIVRDASDYAHQQNAQFEPRLAMDEYGRLLPDPARFPSSAGGAGFKPLADYVHAKGLKFGIHLMRGIPRQAVAANTPILGSDQRAADIANQDPADACRWLNHMWGLKMDQPGAQAYLNSLLEQYASWGVDYIKIDDLTSPIYHGAELEGYRRAIEHAGRPMVLSTSPGPTPLEQAEHVARYANMWRLLPDLWDTWPQLNEAFDVIARWQGVGRPGAWPDPDMLPLGKLRVFGPPTGPRNSQSRLTADEQRALMTLWCISRSPLMFGGHLPDTTSDTLALITNPETLAVNQDSANNRQVIGGRYPVWTADVPGSSDRYVAVFNRTRDGATPVRLRLSDLGIGRAQARDLWRKLDVGPVQGEWALAIPAHGGVLYRLSAIERVEPTTPQPPPPPTVRGTTYEAEAADFPTTGSMQVVERALASGGRAVSGLGPGPVQTLTFRRVRVPAAGRYVLAFVYRIESDAVGVVRINQPPAAEAGARRSGRGRGSIPGARVEWITTAGYGEPYWAAVELEADLQAGDNTIELVQPTGRGPEIDRLVVRPAD